MKTEGAIGPSRGSVQRASASKQRTRPVARSTIGWKKTSTLEIRDRPVQRLFEPHPGDRGVFVADVEDADVAPPLRLGPIERDVGHADKPVRLVG